MNSSKKASNDAETHPTDAVASSDEPTTEAADVLGELSTSHRSKTRDDAALFDLDAEIERGARPSIAWDAREEALRGTRVPTSSSDSEPHLDVLREAIAVAVTAGDDSLARQLFDVLSARPRPAPVLVLPIK